MKPYLTIFLIAATSSLASAQAPVQTVVEETVIEPAPGVPGRKVVVEETVVTPAPGAFDPAAVRRQLGVVPRALPVAPAEVAPLPGSKVETTETTTTVQVPGQPPRVYNSEKSVVIVEGRELPYVTIPVLFVKETAELLDSESRVALQETAGAIMEVLRTSPTAVFDVEGHTSTDGTAELNLDLSAQRARRVYDELTKRYAVPASALTAHGHGENYPSYPNGTEAQMMLDRRVLVVRVN